MQLSVILVAPSSALELERTLYTLSRAGQRELDGVTYEILVADSGTQAVVDDKQLSKTGVQARIVRTTGLAPARAANVAARAALGALIGVIRNGAALASPRLLARALEAHSANKRKAIGALAFDLAASIAPNGPSSGAAAGSGHWARTPWLQDGYKLFSIGALPEGAAEGWFGSLAEPGAAFFDRELWTALGGFDENFALRAVSYAFRDLWTRALTITDNAPWTLLGEATFHPLDEIEVDAEAAIQEYCRLRGHAYAPPQSRPQFVGALSAAMMEPRVGALAAAGRRAISVGVRPFAVGLPPYLLASIQAGTLRSRYKGLKLFKNPFDLAIYLRLLQQLRPRSIIEIGALDGGSALWFRDQIYALNIDATVLSIDRVPPDLVADGVTFRSGDSLKPAESFPTEEIRMLPHPWLVIEDSAHTYDSVSAVLRYMDRLLVSGDYMVVEDGVVADLPDKAFRAYEDGPNRAVQEWLTQQAGRYRIDEALCDTYGYNVTYCPNSWIVRR